MTTIMTDKNKRVELDYDLYCAMLNALGRHDVVLNAGVVIDGTAEKANDLRLSRMAEMVKRLSEEMKAVECRARDTENWDG